MLPVGFKRLSNNLSEFILNYSFVILIFLCVLFFCRRILSCITLSNKLLNCHIFKIIVMELCIDNL